LAVRVFVAVVADVPFVGDGYERDGPPVGATPAAESRVDVLAANGYGVVAMPVVVAYGDSGGCSCETEEVEELHREGVGWEIGFPEINYGEIEQMYNLGGNT
jgi:hypothetical protein